jgi:hypothetical protein
VCVCSLSYPACSGHALYRHLWPVRLYSILSHKRHDFRGKKFIEHKTCVLIFSVTLSGTFLILRRNKRDAMKNIYWSSYKVPPFSFQILMKVEFSRQILEKYSSFKFHYLFHADGRTDRYDEVNSRFSKFYEQA